ncbi:hypothetical protein [Shimia sp. Alg240-R146]|uniref:hypothetical protein n=1 Tax=Shimia sp. Alg240-R146 TaxID=2993449 RepID=UPI0022E05753|nr:hypothetical protein [Shimia sp. Alg240-R146]
MHLDRRYLPLNLRLSYQNEDFSGEVQPTNRCSVRHLGIAMPVNPRLLAIAVTAALAVSQAHSDEAPHSELSLELNAVQEVEGACRVTFVANNTTGAAIDKAVFETVIFDSTGAVVRLSLFDFRALPEGRPRVRQFDVPGMRCETISQTLINGANTCIVNGAESDICGDGLTLSSRISIKLLG